jgi:hypothetical protein
MTHLDNLRLMLAYADMRYSLSSRDQKTIVIISNNVWFEFDKHGNLVSVW